MRQNRVLEVQGHARKGHGCRVDELQQLRAGLLLGRVHVLVALDDVQIDGEPVSMPCERLVAARDLGVALRPEVPHGRRIFDQKRELLAIHRGQQRGRICAERVAHACIEAVIDVREHYIEPGLFAAHGFELRKPVRLHPAHQPRAPVEKLPQARRIGRPRGREQLERVESGGGLKFPPHVAVHGREPRRVRGAFERLEIQLRKIHAVPVKAAEQTAHAGRGRGEAVAVRQVHQLAPVQVRVLKHGRLLAPLGMLIPEAFADVRRLQPRVYENGVPAAGRDEVSEIRIAARIGFEVVPCGDVQGGDARGAPLLRQVVRIGAKPVGGIEERPQAARAERRLDAEVTQRVQQVRIAVEGAGARGRGHPKHGSAAAPHSRHQRRSFPALAREYLRVRRRAENGRFDGLLPHDPDPRDARLFDALDADSLLRRGEAQRRGSLRFAFQNEHLAAVEPLDPRRGRPGSAGPHYRDGRRCAGLETGGGEQVRPHARIRTGHLEEQPREQPDASG